MTKCKIPSALLDNICTRIETKFERIPFKYRGIKITKELVAVTLEILNTETNKKLPQNCRNLIKEKTPDGLDKRIKQNLNTNLRTANIISDVLEKVDIVTVFKHEHITTGRNIKWTKSKIEW